MSPYLGRCSATVAHLPVSLAFYIFKIIKPKMNDMNRIVRWVDTILQEVSNLEAHKGVEILHACGISCSMDSALIEGTIKIRQELACDDIEKLFQAFKNQYYNTSGFSIDGNIITLIFEECTCPLVKLGVSHSYLCNCTLGYSKQIFETLFGRPVEIRLLKSILKKDNVCKQEILVKDVCPGAPSDTKGYSALGVK